MFRMKDNMGLEQLYKFALFFDVIRDSCVQEKGGTKRIKLNISQNFFWVIKGYFDIWQVHKKHY